MSTQKIRVSVIDGKLKFHYEGSVEFLPDSPQPTSEIDLSEDPADDIDCTATDNTATSVSTVTAPLLGRFVD